MTFYQPKRRGKKLLFAATLMLGMVSPALVSAGSTSDTASWDTASRIDLLEFQAQSLSHSLAALTGQFDQRGLSPFTIIPPANIGETPDIVVAQSRDVAAQNLRISQMEEQMRILVGQVEGLQFQMTQFQTLIERLQEDNEFRFQQLEGGGSGKTDAVTQSGSDTLTGGLPQDEILSAPLDLNIEEGPVVGTNDSVEAMEINDDSDDDFIFGSNPDSIDGLPTTLNGDGQALDLSFDPGSLVTDGDADAQYRAGFEAVMQGDYLFAETQFRQFVALFPNHSQAPDAINWLGEALLQRQQYDEAAQVLFDGFQSYENSTRAPDLLFRLGIALAGAGERDTACRTFGEVTRRYPHMGETFADRVGQEMAKAQC